MRSGGSYPRLWLILLSYPVMIHFLSVTYIPAFLGRRITVFHLSFSLSQCSDVPTVTISTVISRCTMFSSSSHIANPSHVFRMARGFAVSPTHEGQRQKLYAFARRQRASVLPPQVP
jgi:hypothetical protein